MLALFVVVAIVVVAGIALLVARDRPLIADDPVGSRALAWSAEGGVDPQDLAEVRFAVALRGYRMEEVDRVLDDAREALAGRDARIADLQLVVAALGGAPGNAGAAGPEADRLDPTGPTDPTDPSDPTDPTPDDPTDPTDPTDPADPAPALAPESLS